MQHFAEAQDYATAHDSSNFWSGMIHAQRPISGGAAGKSWGKSMISAARANRAARFVKRSRGFPESIEIEFERNYELRMPGPAGATSSPTSFSFGSAGFAAASLAAAATFAASFAAADREPRPESRLNCRIL
jgi:hypothetical protein